MHNACAGLISPTIYAHTYLHSLALLPWLMPKADVSRRPETRVLLILCALKHVPCLAGRHLINLLTHSTGVSHRTVAHFRLQTLKHTHTILSTGLTKCIRSCAFKPIEGRVCESKLNKWEYKKNRVISSYIFVQ